MSRAHTVDEHERIRAAILGAQVGSMTGAELLLLQENLGFGQDPFCIDVPACWLPPGNSRILSRRRIQLVPAEAPGCLRRSIADAMRRAALARYLVPTRGRRGHRSLISLSSWTSSVLMLRRLVRLAFAEGHVSPGRVFRDIPLDLLGRIFKGRTEQIEANAYFALHQLSHFVDWPENGVAASTHEAPVAGTPPLWASPPAREHQPLSDEFLALFAARCLSYMQTWGCPLITATRKLARQWRADQSDEARRSAQRRTLLAFDWPAVAEGRPYGRLSEPPTNLYALVQRLWTLQTCHQAIMHLTLGARPSEVLALEGPTVDGRGAPIAVGRHFKGVAAQDGAARDWPIEDVAQAALVQQKRLRDSAWTLFEARDGVHREGSFLWITLRRNGGRLCGEETYNFSGCLHLLVVAFGLDSWLAPGERVCPTRIRKSFARMTALGVFDAAPLVKHMFGHRQMETTLRYIHAERGLHAQLRQADFEKEPKSNGDANSMDFWGGLSRMANTPAQPSVPKPADPSSDHNRAGMEQCIGRIQRARTLRDRDSVLILSRELVELANASTQEPWIDTPIIRKALRRALADIQRHPSPR